MLQWYWFLCLNNTIKPAAGPVAMFKPSIILEVNRLKNTFAKHDLNMLSMAKPKLIERIINKGTAKVGRELEALTEPNQFDEKIITDNANTD